MLSLVGPIVQDEKCLIKLLLCVKCVHWEGMTLSLFNSRKVNSAGADGGPRSRVCACSTLRSAPHQHQRTFVAAHVFKVAFKHLPQPLRSHIRILEPQDFFLTFESISIDELKLLSWKEEEE